MSGRREGRRGAPLRVAAPADPFFFPLAVSFSFSSLSARSQTSFLPSSDSVDRLPHGQPGRATDRQGSDCERQPAGGPRLEAGDTASSQTGGQAVSGQLSS